MKKICVILLVFILGISLYHPAVISANTDIINYEIYNQYDELVEEGVLSSNTRASWSTITLQSGYYVNLRSNGNAFAFSSGNTMRLQYTLSTTGTITSYFMKTSTPSGAGSVWYTTSKTAASRIINKTADASAYYYPKLSNTGSSTITITSVSFN